MKTNLALAFIATTLFSSCSITNDKSEEMPQLKFKVINNSNKFIKELDFTPLNLTKCSDNEKKDSTLRKSNVVKAYARSIRFMKQSPDGIVTFTANKDSLKVTKELFNMITYMIEEGNTKIEQLKKERGAGNYTVSPVKSFKYPKLESISIESLNALYYKANK
jgi:hypothetical protein